MTLEQTAQEAIEMITAEDLSKWASRHDKVVIDALRAAIHDEQAQAVEQTATKTEQIAGAISRHISTPLFQREVLAAAQYIVHRYLHPAPPPAGERANLIDTMHLTAKQIADAGHSGWGNACSDAADMLEADAQEIALCAGTLESRDRNIASLLAENARLLAQQVAAPYDEQAQAVDPVAWMHPSRDPHLLSHSAYTYGSASVPLYLHPAPPPYDQQALELCPECGWKAIMPGESCFVCNLQTEALSDFDMRGVLASRLLCWHRLTEAEAQDLICFFEKVRAQQVAVPPGWVLTSDKMPEPCVNVLAHCGKKQPIRAQWVPAKTLEDTGDNEFFGEYDEATDQTYWPEGWYETNAFEETHWMVDGPVTHWMPLPHPPQGDKP